MSKENRQLPKFCQLLCLCATVSEIIEIVCKCFGCPEQLHKYISSEEADSMLTRTLEKLPPLA